MKNDKQTLWRQIFAGISIGASLPAALATVPEPRPSLWWVKMAIRNDPELAEQYRAAIELRADALSDEISAIADEPIPAGLRGPDASAWVQLQRLRVDAKKWTASKLFPRRYSDRVELSVDVAQRISINAALAQAERRIEMISAKDLTIEEPHHARIG